MISQQRDYLVLYINTCSMYLETICFLSAATGFFIFVKYSYLVIDKRIFTSFIWANF